MFRKAAFPFVDSIFPHVRATSDGSISRAAARSARLTWPGAFSEAGSRARLCMYFARRPLGPLLEALRGRHRRVVRCITSLPPPPSLSDKQPRVDSLRPAAALAPDRQPRNVPIHLM
ncbi:hypothetical protein CIHG_07814 [Coccidioides immitis H538.4]|uniref:Uncharacterized protein n=2 Tax=Coccidioides immitis TaxID=5501 RepID=A0A0J8RXA7_COCIT|nr:hypothetical protein CIRG_05638 [Coccidioides immitis RMSCC 2394]KMU89780.1 hypothetical protein CIHG_07814 [Coccidioides immitis H538.4]